MNSNMDRRLHHQNVQRALALGHGADPGTLPELARLLEMPSSEVRRLAASAIGKLASFGADPTFAVRALAPIALRDPHPQAQQYALKAIKAYGAAARQHLQDLDDLAVNEQVKDYYLPELDLYIEYWGMDTADYKIGMLKKQQLYQQEGKRLISLYPSDKPSLDAVLGAKLALFGYHIPSPTHGIGDAIASQPHARTQNEPPHLAQTHRLRRLLRSRCRQGDPLRLPISAGLWRPASGLELRSRSTR